MKASEFKVGQLWEYNDYRVLITDIYDFKNERSYIDCISEHKDKLKIRHILMSDIKKEGKYLGEGNLNNLDILKPCIFMSKEEIQQFLELAE